ncbi:MAG: glycoside hydrolase family 25 [Pseudonocardia sp.]|jgi:LysM repeat protein|nr:glycoside hydrolase family 25 [Pseudonocardia sp.]
MNHRTLRHLLVHTPRRLLNRAGRSSAGSGLSRPAALVGRAAYGLLLLLVGFVTVLWLTARHDGPASVPSVPPAVAASTPSAPPSMATRTPPPSPAGASPPLPPASVEVGGNVVTEGDTLAVIALRYGVPFEQLAADNGITEANQIMPGHRLRVGQPARDVVVIQPGATLSAYAASSGTTVTALMALNPHISNADRILAGGTLRLPVEALR